MKNEDPDDTFAGMDPQACPTAEWLDVIGTQWRLHVLRDLQNGEVQFNELKEETGASSRTLSQALDALMDAGLVAKRMEEAAPVATYYSLTEKGEALGPVFDELDAWAREYVDPAEYTEE
jgi:DNA-binding HxlR family transcriptional regulator